MAPPMLLSFSPALSEDGVLLFFHRTWPGDPNSIAVQATDSAVAWNEEKGRHANDVKDPQMDRLSNDAS